MPPWGDPACGDPRVLNQRTLFHLRDGLERALQNSPTRMPSRPRVEDLAKNLREKDAAEAQKMVGANR